MILRKPGNQLVFEYRNPVEVGGFRVGTEAAIYGAFVQPVGHFPVAAFLHAHGDARVAAAEFFQDSGQAQGGDAVIASDSECSADHAADLGTDLFCVLAGTDNFAEERQHDFAVLCQAYPFFAANKKGKADLRF